MNIHDLFYPNVNPLKTWPSCVWSCNQMYLSWALRWTLLFLDKFCLSIPTGLYGTGLAGYLGFLQNRNIKGELAQASVFVFFRGKTAPTGFLGWRDERREGVGRSPSLYSPLFSLLSHSLLLCITQSICADVWARKLRHLTAKRVLDYMRWVPLINCWVSACRPEQIGWQVGRQRVQVCVVRLDVRATTALAYRKCSGPYQSSSW